VRQPRWAQQPFSLMDASEEKQEIERLRYRADRWRETIKDFDDSKTIEALIEFAAELDRKADALEAELAEETMAATGTLTELKE
jgi:molecular chaperone GrpE (heat shock protein)